LSKLILWGFKVSSSSFRFKVPHGNKSFEFSDSYSAMTVEAKEAALPEFFPSMLLCV
jgi:hypothetical protein